MPNYVEKRPTQDNSTLAQLAQPLLKKSGVGRRSFLKQLGVGGTALVPVAGLMASGGIVLADKPDHEEAHDKNLSKDDAAILRFLAAAELQNGRIILAEVL